MAFSTSLLFFLLYFQGLCYFFLSPAALLVLVACSTSTFQGTFSAQEEVPPITFKEIFFGQESTYPLKKIKKTEGDSLPHQFVPADRLEADVGSLCVLLKEKKEL